MQVARKLLGPIWPDWSDEAKFMTTVALGQQLIFPVLAVGVVALVLSSSAMAICRASSASCCGCGSSACWRCCSA